MHVGLQYTHVVYERGVDKARFGVGDKRGQDVHDVLARVHRKVYCGHGNDVRKREREQIAGGHGVGHERVRGRAWDVHERKDHVVKGDDRNVEPKIGWHGDALRVLCQVAVFLAVVQPDHDKT